MRIAIALVLLFAVCAAAALAAGPCDNFNCPTGCECRSPIMGPQCYQGDDICPGWCWNWTGLHQGYGVPCTPTPTPAPDTCAPYNSCEACASAPGCPDCNPYYSCGWSIAQAKCLPGNTFTHSFDSSSMGVDWIYDKPCPAASPTPDPCNFTKSVSNQGNVAVAPAGSDTEYHTDADSRSTITFTQGQTQFLVVRIYENTRFRLSPCSMPQQFGGERPGLMLEGGCGRGLQFSSEHSSIRGTINGGGDFIQGAEPHELTLDPVPAPLVTYGRVSVSETKQATGPDFTLDVSLRTGRMRVAMEGDHAEYTVTPYLAEVVAQGGSGGARLDGPPPPSVSGAEINVTAGSVVVSDVESGGSKIVSEGGTEFITIGQLAALAATPTPEETPETSPTPEPGPLPCFGFVLLLAGGIGALYACKH